MSTNNRNSTIEPAVVWRRWRNTAIVLLFLGFLFVSLPVTLPYVAVPRWRDRRRLRRAARNFRCPACDAPIGDAAIQLAEQHWTAELDEYRKQHPGLKFHFHRPYDAVCPRCDARFAFRPQTRSFRPVSASL